jgi:glucose uptake protein GlcU
MHNAPAIAAIVCSAASLFALLVLHSTRWTAVLNVLAIILILTSIRMRVHPSDNNVEDSASKSPTQDR